MLSTAGEAAGGGHRLGFGPEYGGGEKEDRGYEYPFVFLGPLNKEDPYPTSRPPARFSSPLIKCRRLVSDAACSVAVELGSQCDFARQCVLIKRGPRAEMP